MWVWILENEFDSHNSMDFITLEHYKHAEYMPLRHIGEMRYNYIYS
jgi:hypothetical protein